jgi:hypothetical protein
MFQGKPSAHSVLLAIGCAAGAFLSVGLAALPTSLPAAPLRQGALTPVDTRLLNEIEGAGFLYFAEQAHPRTGLVRDRARADGSPSEGKASIAASGFALSAWVIAVEHGWVERAAAVAQVRRQLHFLANTAPRQHGFFYHFMEMESGARAWQCEVSTIDTSLLLAGAIVAREYFADPEITAQTDRLLAEVDWAWFRHGGQLVSLGWHDETGFSRYRWNKYSEHVLMSFLALGVSPRPVEADYWRNWSRAPVGRYGDRVYLQEPPLFVHQYPQAYLDLRDRRDGFADYHRNSQLATLAQRQFCTDLKPEFPAWGENLWGVTASDSATGYKAWGGPPRTTGYNALDGTIVPCAAAGSLPFAPQETLAVLHHLKQAYGDKIWRRYGFVDAFNPMTGWVNADVIGIDLGISVVQAENLRSGLIQRLFMQSREAQLALGKAALLSTRRTLTPAETEQVRTLAASAWRALQTTPARAGLQLTAILAARELGLLDNSTASVRVRALLTSDSVPTAADVAVQYAAGLIAVRQALPELAPEATALLGKISWNSLTPAAPQLGGESRLTVFLQVALGARPPAAWSALERTTVPANGVQVLAPAQPAGQLVPGLWLDERAIVTGASASQLAYAQLTSTPVGAPVDALTFALLLEHFPAEALPRLSAGFAPGSDTPEAQAALLVTAANLLGPDGVRRWFQQDPQVCAARSAIAEFGEAAFGASTSLIAQRELAGPNTVPPPRQATAAAAGTPRKDWDWHTVAGLEFKDSAADVRDGDAPLEMRFAFTWDAAALHFHAEVVDTPAGFNVPPERHRLVELFVDPANDGLVWAGPGDYQFIFPQDGRTTESFHHVAAQAKIRRTAQGYIIESSLPWTSLGLKPRGGLELGVSPAVLSEGTREWEPSLKLNWSCAPENETRTRLGRLRLL